MSFYNIKDTRTVRRIDRLRDLLTESPKLTGPYAGRAYRGEIRCYHDMTNIAEAESPTLVVMSPSRRSVAQTAGGPGVGSSDKNTVIAVVALVCLPDKATDDDKERLYRLTTSLSDLVGAALEDNVKDPTGGDSLWYTMTYTTEQNLMRGEGKGFVSETIVTLHSQDRTRDRFAPY